MATAVITKSNESVSAQRPTPTRRDIIFLLGLILLFCLFVEIGTAVLFGRVSKIQRRFRAERNGALSVSKSGSKSPSILIVGNSLLEEGIDLRVLRTDVGSSAQVTRYAVSNTSYLDWYYGLRRLFRDGSHPDVVVVMLNPLQLMSHGFAGDLAVQSMVDPRDLLRLADDLGSSNTEASALFADQASAFYGSRGEIRNWALHAVFPRFEEIRSSLKPTTPPLPSNDEIIARVERRLESMKQVCKENGAEMILLIPPSLANDGSEGVERAADQIGIPIFAPFKPGELTADLYSDGFHLNQRGAERFTAKVAELIRAYSGQKSQQGSD